MDKKWFEENVKKEEGFSVGAGVREPENAADAAIQLQKEFTLLQKQLEQQAKSIEVLVEAAEEIEMLIKDYLDGSYDIDSFTIQPLSIALSKFKTNKQDK